MKKKVLITILALAVVAAGVFAIARTRNKDSAQDNNSSGSSQQPQASEPAVPPQSGEVAITISNFKFSPEKLVIKKGSTVTWTNQDDAQHDIASDSDSDKRGLSSPLLTKGKSFSNTFNEVGIFKYHCRPHPYMMGSVEVVE